jgi:hypothetical protein
MQGQQIVKPDERIECVIIDLRNPTEILQTCATLQCFDRHVRTLDAVFIARHNGSTASCLFCIKLKLS